MLVLKQVPEKIRFEVLKFNASISVHAVISQSSNTCSGTTVGLLVTVLYTPATSLLVRNAGQDHYELQNMF